MIRDEKIMKRNDEKESRQIYIMQRPREDGKQSREDGKQSRENGKQSKKERNGIKQSKEDMEIVK